MFGGLTDSAPVEASPQLVYDRDDDNGEFVPRYIPASGMEVDSSSSDDELPVEGEGDVPVDGLFTFGEDGISEEGSGIGNIAGIVKIASQLSKKLSVVAAEQSTEEDVSSSPSSSPPKKTGSSVASSLPGSVPDSSTDTPSELKPNGEDDGVQRKQR